jgi:predicted nucleic acid-binding protein
MLEKYQSAASFYSPDVCFEDARQYLTKLFKEKKRDPKIALTVLDKIGGIVKLVERSVYVGQEQLARKRVELRDADDWPVAAVALLFELPIWTEDKDFFGSGIATWTSDRVEIYLRQ